MNVDCQLLFFFFCEHWFSWLSTSTPYPFIAPCAFRNVAAHVENTLCYLSKASGSHWAFRYESPMKLTCGEYWSMPFNANQSNPSVRSKVLCVVIVRDSYKITTSTEIMFCCVNWNLDHFYFLCLFTCVSPSWNVK